MTKRKYIEPPKEKIEHSKKARQERVRFIMQKISTEQEQSCDTLLSGCLDLKSEIITTCTGMTLIIDV